jgi:hypothetical protein
MEDFLDILKYILPSVITFLASYLIIKRFLDNDYRKKTVDIKMQNQKTIMPVRLQAYERLVLLLERISLPSLIQRTHKQGMSARMLQAELVKAIRAEFDHNLSQQVYITNKSWESVKTAKEETIKAINIAASRVGDDADFQPTSLSTFLKWRQGRSSDYGRPRKKQKREISYRFRY